MRTTIGPRDTMERLAQRAEKANLHVVLTTLNGKVHQLAVRKPGKRFDPTDRRASLARGAMVASRIIHGGDIDQAAKRLLEQWR